MLCVEPKPTKLSRSCARLYLLFVIVAAMVDLSSLKGKAQSRVQGLQDRLHSAPSTTYAAPSGPSSSSSAAPSNQERFAQSTVLNYQKAINRPGPPPRRIVSSSSATNVTASSGSPPALPGRSVPAAPSLPPRNASTEVYDRDPVPPYEANQSTSPLSWKRFSEYTSQDKRELFAMLDQVRPLAVRLSALLRR